MGKRFKKFIEKCKIYAWRTILLGVVAFGGFLVGRPLISLIKTTIEIRELSAEKALYEKSIRQDSLLIENLKNDEFLERYAREKYFMQGKDEQVFIIE